MKTLRAPDLNIGYTPINVARSNSLAADLLADASARRAIIDANSADIELYEYVTTELYPAFQREYGPTLSETVDEYRNSPHKKFNRRNLEASRVKQFALYKPLLRLHRNRAAAKINAKPLH
jgi:hypothetical protein